MNINARPYEIDDIEKIVDYFLDAEESYIRGMGAEKAKLPKRNDWVKTLQLELEKPFSQKNLYYVIWELDGRAVGHSNINHINFGDCATMHLHVWRPNLRKNGLGLAFLKLTVPIYFEYFSIQKLICEPFSKNVPPNKTLSKFGFQFIKTYETIPGPINYFQAVSRYEYHKKQLGRLL